MTDDEALAALQANCAFYSRGDGHDGFIAVSGLNGKHPHVAVFRHVTDGDVGRAAVHALADADTLDYQVVTIRDMAAALRFHESNIVYSTYTTELAIRELVQEIAEAGDIRQNLGQVKDYLAAVERLRAFEAKEYGYVYDVDDDPLDYLHGDYANLTRVPVAATVIDNPLLPNTPEAFGMFDVQVYCDLVHAELETDITWFKPVVERYENLSDMRQRLLESLDFNRLCGWEDDIERALRSRDTRLSFKHERTREMLCDVNSPIYHTSRFARPATSLPFSEPQKPIIDDPEEVL